MSKQAPIKSTPIPIIEAQCLAEDYGYDQVMIFAFNREEAINHRTTYGRTKELCKEAGEAAQTVGAIMGWGGELGRQQLIAAIAYLNKKLTEQPLGLPSKPPRGNPSK